MYAWWEQPGARSGDGSVWQPVPKFVLALDAHVEIHGGANVAPPAIGAAFEQCRTAAGPRAAYRINGGAGEQAHALAIQLQSLDAPGVARPATVGFDAPLSNVHAARMNTFLPNA